MQTACWTILSNSLEPDADAAHYQPSSDTTKSKISANELILIVATSGGYGKDFVQKRSWKLTLMFILF